MEKGGRLKAEGRRMKEEARGKREEEKAIFLFILSAILDKKVYFLCNKLAELKKKPYICAL